MSARCVILYIFCALLLLQCNTNDPLSGARPVLEKIAISSSEKIFIVGEKYQFRATGEFSKRQPQDKTQDITFSVTWTSSDTNLVKIEPKTGIAKFASTGKAHIVAVSTGEEGKNIQSQFDFQIFGAVKLHAGIQPADLVITSDSRWALFTESNKVHSVELSDMMLTHPESINKGELAINDFTTGKIVLSKRALSNRESIAYVVGRNNEDISVIATLNLSSLPVFALQHEVVSSRQGNILSIYADASMDSVFVILSSGQAVITFKSTNRLPTLLQIGSSPKFVGGKSGTRKLVAIDTPPKIWIRSFHNNSDRSIETDNDFAQDYSMWPHPISNKVYIIAGVNRLYPLSLDNPPNTLTGIALSEDPEKMAFSEQNNKAFIVTNFRNVMVFDTSSDRYLNTVDKNVPNPALFPEMGEALDVKIDSTGNFAYILAKDSGSAATQRRLYKYNIEGRKLIRAISTQGQPTFLKISPNGRWLFTLDAASKGAIYVFPAF